MSQKIFVGIDLAKESSSIAAVDEERNMALSPFSITNTIDGMEKLILKLKSYEKDKILRGMEASSNYWENIYSYLSQKGKRFKEKCACHFLTWYFASIPR